MHHHAKFHADWSSDFSVFIDGGRSPSWIWYSLFAPPEKSI